MRLMTSAALGCKSSQWDSISALPRSHLPVVEYVNPETFALYGEIARRKGFEFVASGPLVRSSYHAADFNPVQRTG